MLSRFASSRSLLSASRAAGMPLGRAAALPRVASVRFYSNDSLSYEEFTKKYEQEFEDAYDVYEVQRVLNNAFSYDLVPAPTVIEKALLAARRVNDYATASRVFEALKFKVETKEQYQAYLEELKETREELGVTLHEELFPESD